MVRIYTLIIVLAAVSLCAQPFTQNSPDNQRVKHSSGSLGPAPTSFANDGMDNYTWSYSGTNPTVWEYEVSSDGLTWTPTGITVAGSARSDSGEPAGDCYNHVRIVGKTSAGGTAQTLPSASVVPPC